jgi:hypothetical protein
VISYAVMPPAPLSRLFQPGASVEVDGAKLLGRGFEGAQANHDERESCDINPYICYIYNCHRVHSFSLRSTYRTLRRHFFVRCSGSLGNMATMELVFARQLLMHLCSAVSLLQMFALC